MDVLSEKPKDFISTYKIPLAIGAFALFLFILGLRLLVFPINKPQIEFSEATQSGQLNASNVLKIDVEGAVVNPGVYELADDARVQDALVKAGGLDILADRDWVVKNVNLAAKLVDGTKIYIPKKDEIINNSNNQSILGTSNNISKGIININNASIAELDTLSGIGEVTAQKIINNRPYGAIEELISKKVVSQSVFEKIKDKIGVY